MEFDPKHGPISPTPTSPVYEFTLPDYTTTMAIHDTAIIRMGDAELTLAYVEREHGPAIDIIARTKNAPPIQLGYFRIYLEPFKPKEGDTHE